MEKLIFFDHACHKKTKSFKFLEEILRQKFDVIVHYYDKFYEYKINDENVRDYDYAVYCQFLPGRFKICHEGVKAVFVPMYDGEWGSYWAWKRISFTNMAVLSFSTTLSQWVRKCGVKNILDVHYFPNPADYLEMSGDPKIAMLWERGDAKFELLKQLFKPGDLKKTILFRHPEEGVTYHEISQEDISGYNVEIISTPFLPKEEFLKVMREAGTIIAPRRKEGIGMSFLEGMAMKKCIIAHNDATMNEYIIDGVNGILLSFDKPRPLDIDMICELHHQIPDPQIYYNHWLEDQDKIVSFVKSCAPTYLSRWDKACYILSCPLFLLEGAIYRLCTLLSSWIRRG